MKDILIGLFLMFNTFMNIHYIYWVVLKNDKRF